MKLFRERPIFRASKAAVSTAPETDPTAVPTPDDSTSAPPEGDHGTAAGPAHLNAQAPQTRQVITRAPDDGPSFPDPKAEALEDPAAPPQEPSRRRIWDLNAPEQAPNIAAETPTGIGADISADDVAQARLLIAQMSAAAGPAGQSDEHNKTRILGFRAAELAAQDPFTQGKSLGQARGPDFPVGWVLVLSGPGQGASFTLTGGVSSIGRGQDQTICLSFGDNSISRQNHASVAYDDETRSFFLGHGGKSNIVRLNDRPVLSTEDLVHGDKIRLGETTLLFLALCGETFDWADPDSGEVVNVCPK